MSAGVPFIIPALTSDDGTPVSGALVYFKRKGTSTPQAAYSDEDLGTATTNPAVADAGGRKVVYLDPLLNYDIQVKTADAATTLLSVTYNRVDAIDADGDGGSVDPIDYEAAGDAIKGTDGVATALDNTFTSAGASFAAADIGKLICIHGAGTSSLPFVTTIASINSATSIELSAPAITTVASSATYAYGTDDTAALGAAAAAAVAAKLPLNLKGRTYAVSGNCDLSYDNLIIEADGATIIQLNPGATTKTVYATGASDLLIKGLKVDRFGNGRGGAIGTQAGIWLDQCPRAKVIDCEVYGNDEGNGIVVWLSPQASIVRPYIHDLYYYHVAQSDDVINGIWIVYSDDFLIESPRLKKFGRTDQTSASRDRYNRGIALSGSRGGVINNPQTWRCDQVIDATGSGGNSNIVVNGGNIRHPYSAAVKFANSAVSCKAIGVLAEGAGLYAFIASGPVSSQMNPTRDIDFVGCTAHNTGCSKQQTAANIKGFSVERGSGSASPYSSYPKSVKFKSCDAVSDSGTATVTVSSTTVLAVSASTPVSLTLGARVQFTTTGTLPTGLALATDYWIVPVRDSLTLHVATSYNNALDAYEAMEAGTSHTSYIVSTLAGGSGTHTMTLFQDMYDGFYDNIAAADVDTTATNRAIGCTSIGETNKKFSGIATGVPAWASFNVRLSGDLDNVTGDATQYTVLWDTEVSDPSGSYDPATGIFTAPETGLYMLAAHITMDDVAAGNDRIFLEILTSNRSYSKDLGDMPADANTRVGISLSALADMDEGDEARVRILVSGGGGGKIIDIKSGDLSSFSGAKVGG